MHSPTHVDMSLAAAELVDFPNSKIVAREAATPDKVRSIEVAGQGAHMFGHNFAALAHFCMPTSGYYVDGTYRGYRWSGDYSVPNFDLPDRDVISNWKVWMPILPESWAEKDPLNKLIKTLTNPDTRGTIAADEITYPTAAIMADWLWNAYMDAFKPMVMTESHSVLAGWILHFVQDTAVPHHVWGELWDGHAAFESLLQERWTELRMKKNPILAEWEAQGLTGKIERPRWICENNAWEGKEWFRTWWRPRKRADQVLRRGYISTIKCLRFLMKVL